MPGWPTYCNAQWGDDATFDIENPRPEDVRIYDIAMSLSRINRYLGHTRIPVSVAEHCLRTCERVPQEYKLDALMHDCAEAYVGDVISPVKKLLGPGFARIEQRVYAVIAQKYGFSVHVPEVVKEADYQEYLWESNMYFINNGYLVGPNEMEVINRFCKKFFELNQAKQALILSEKRLPASIRPVSPGQISWGTYVNPNYDRYQEIVNAFRNGQQTIYSVNTSNAETNNYSIDE